jgi:hypothetical protein
VHFDSFDVLQAEDFVEGLRTDLGEDFDDEEEDGSAVDAAGGVCDSNGAEASCTSCAMPREELTPEDMDALLEHSFLMTVTGQGSATSKITFPIETQKLYEQYMKSNGVLGVKLDVKSSNFKKLAKFSAYLKKAKVRCTASVFVCLSVTRLQRLWAVVCML